MKVTASAIRLVQISAVTPDHPDPFHRTFKEEQPCHYIRGDVKTFAERTRSNAPAFA
ncbi:hypothetical protein KOR42_39540 [Thalassoglobus neptunius]|uniref:Uncharacterized protein n=1 Tax=Thalassoglobus neptunius TaxID=1938619 RepID=A0A5C5WDP9_9PLAN|nr:hypothetical protein [Thalassoglobus neptunius]TWT49038.1 hypothetical protein KOR42_39540 [Thalassoglobus neptunius]